MQAMLTGGSMILIWDETACSMEKKITINILWYICL